MIKTTKRKALPLKVWLVISVIVASYQALIICPEIERLEEGKDVSINCDISFSDKFDIRWYKGRIPSAEPILELKNVRSDVVEHHKGGTYGITSTGRLTIYNLKKEHEGFYFVHVIYENEQIAGRRIELKVTAMPSPSYPHIDSCSTFEDCKIKVENKTNLTCKLNGIRPMVPIKWIIQNTRNATISTLPQIAEHDKDTDTWNVSITLLYTALSCNSTVSLQCKAEGDWKLLKQSVASASLSIKKGNCTDEWTIWRLHLSFIERFTKPLVVLVVVLSTLAITIVLGGGRNKHLIFPIHHKLMDNLQTFFYQIVNRLPVKGDRNKHSIFPIHHKLLDNLQTFFYQIVNRLPVKGDRNKHSTFPIHHKLMDNLQTFFYQIVNRLPVKGKRSKHSIFPLHHKLLDNLQTFFYQIVNCLSVKGLLKGRNNKKSTNQSNSFSSKYQFSSDEEEESEESTKQSDSFSSKDQFSSDEQEQSEEQREYARKALLKADFFSSDEEEYGSSSTLQSKKRKTQKRQVKAKKKPEK